MLQGQGRMIHGFSFFLSHSREGLRAYHRLVYARLQWNEVNAAVHGLKNVRVRRRRPYAIRNVQSSVDAFFL